MGNVAGVTHHCSCTALEKELGFERLDDALATNVVEIASLRSWMPQSDTQIIFDWDDTLMCSSVIKTGQNIALEDRRRLQDVVVQLLRASIELGDTTIVTNATLTWVQSTASMLPEVAATLNSVRLVSARDIYEAKWPGQSCMWKVNTFRDLLVRDGTGSSNANSPCDSNEDYNSPEKPVDLDSSPIVFQNLASTPGPTHRATPSTNLVVIGDSMDEIQAGNSMRQEKCCSTVKTVKLKALPTVEDLLGQLEALLHQLESIVRLNCNVSKTFVQKNEAWELIESSLDAGSKHQLGPFAHTTFPEHVWPEMPQDLPPDALL
eukprot:TRINITY_DN101051_c0_g1_i1.p1 TRINITY_DN101051_c0_g1~~TRINITY_DN101051_c0_g1_i1.p1  ORF type:complete len:320 (-),score=73.31 TRINITY_DN101051_c0_g1_i1:160-1119(-)